MSASPLSGTFFADRPSMRGKVGVVTGAASGIGLEFARRCVLEFGMTVLLADVDAAGLQREVDRLNEEINDGDRDDGGIKIGSKDPENGRAIAVPVDVRKRADYVRLLERARRASSSACVDVCLLNAGVLGAGVNVLTGGELTQQERDWRWVLDVNLFGVLHGLQVFIPYISQQSRPGLVAVTASDRGLDIGGAPGCTAGYATSKHAVLAMCESLEGELVRKNLDKQIQLSVMCPGLVASKLWDAKRAEEQRPASDKRGAIQARDSQRMIMEEWGTSLEDTIDTFLEGMARGQFICDSVPGQAQESFGRRAEYILGGFMPSDRRIQMPTSKL